jgi:hypothetical protein
MREDQDKVFYREADDLLKEDHRYIKSWLRLTERTLRIAKKETEKNSNSRQMMENFFRWKPPESAKQQKADELQPD